MDEAKRKEEKLKRFDALMRERFGPKWPRPEEVEERARKLETEKADAPARTKPNRAENEFMMNLMVLRNALIAQGPKVRDRAKQAGRYTWRDIRLMARLCDKVQKQMMATMPMEKQEYYEAYTRHGHYELMINGPIRNETLLLISDRHLAAICQAAMENDCCMCMREGNEIGKCLLREGLLEVAPPTQIQEGRWRKCEYREAAGKMIKGEDIEI